MDDDYLSVVPDDWSPGHDYDPAMDDYAPDLDATEGVEVAEEVMPTIAKQASNLGLSAPAVFFVADLDVMARFIDGTEPDPVFVVDWQHFAPLLYSEQLDELETTLMHELGHAYVRSMGVEAPWGDEHSGPEEKAVERFARTRDVEALMAWAEEQIDE
jgi:hypothetical protein